MKLFEARPPVAILTSSYLRCRQTVEPLATRFGLGIADDPRLAEGSPWRLALDLINDAAPGTVLCSQGDVIGGVVMDLVRRGVLRARDARWQKSGIWHLDVRHGAVVGATYTSAP